MVDKLKTVLSEYLKDIFYGNKIIFIVFAVVYHIGLDFYYVTTVNPLYEYMGFELNPSGIKYILSWVIYLLIFFIIPKSENSVSSLFLNLQFIIIFAPMTVYYALNNQSTVYLLMVSLMIIIQVFILYPNRKHEREKALSVRLYNLDKYTSAFMTFFIPGILLITMVWGGFYGLNAFDLDYLYKIRSSSEYPTILSYLISWITCAIIPFYISLNLSRKKYILVTCLVLTDLMFYMILGQKFIYLSILVVFTVFIFSKTKNLIKFIYFGFTSLSLIAPILYLLEKLGESSRFSEIFSSFIGLRFLFTPALNKFLYFDFFNQHPNSYFSDGFIGKSFGLTYPYKESLGQTIYAYMTEGDLFVSNSNTGYFGDSYAQLGFLGLLIMSILLAFIIKFFNYASRGFSFLVIAPILSLIIVILNDGALLTTLLTNGFLVTILLLLIYNKHQGKEYFRGDLL